MTLKRDADELIKINKNASKSDLRKYKLCYVENSVAYFTDDFNKQWGDDWDDAPYEYNAGRPYSSLTNIIKIWYNADLIEPSEGHFNSPFSVKSINNGASDWLKSPSYSKQKISIKPKTNIVEFIDLIQESGGECNIPLSMASFFLMKKEIRLWKQNKRKHYDPSHKTRFIYKTTEGVGNYW